MTEEDLTEHTNILEAVNNLSSIAEINLKGVAGKTRPGGQILEAHRWFDAKNEVKTIGRVKGTLKTVHKYLKYIYAKETGEVRDPHIQKGIRSIMELAKEAAEKIDTYYSLQGYQKIAESNEFKSLLDFYKKKILSKFKETLEEEEKWQEELQREEDVLDIQRRGLKDLESVIRDRDYELFYLTKEDGSLFFNTNLLRHIRLVTDFDQIIAAFREEDPLLKLQVFEDRMVMHLAKHIALHIRLPLTAFLKSAGKYRDDIFIRTIFKAILALFLASNAKNSILTTTTRTCRQFFRDFMTYYKEALNSIDYRAVMEGEVQDGFMILAAELLHAFAQAIYTHKKDHREILAYLLSMISFGEKDAKVQNAQILFHMTLDFHDELTAKLQHFPSGPLFKALDVFHAREYETHFDPFLLGDFPTYTFSVKENGRTVRFLQFGSPTVQRKIDEAHILQEFRALVRSFAAAEDKILIVNLQDRTHWKDHARSKAIETFQQGAEFRPAIEVVTLAVNTPFYQQTDDYFDMHSKADFTQALYEQITGGEACGYFFPHKILDDKVKKIIEFTSRTFFGESKNINRKERLDFIELVHTFLIIHLIFSLKCTFVGIMGKDGLDLASVFSAGLFAVFHLFNERVWKEEEYTFFLALMFAPTLLLRERAVDGMRLSRTVSMLSTFAGIGEKKWESTKSSLASLLEFHPDDLTLQLKELT